MKSRSLMIVCLVVVAAALALPAMAQPGGPPPAGGPGGPGGPPGMGPGGMPGGGMMGGGGGIASAPPVLVVTDKYIYVVWLGTLSQYDVNGLTLVKSVQLPAPMRGMGGRHAGGDAGAGAPGAPPAPAAPPPGQ